MKKHLKKPAVLSKKRSVQKIGKAPGTISYFGNKEGVTQFLSLISYTKESFSSSSLSVEKELKECLIPTSNIHWLNVVGLNDANFINKIGNSFNLNALSLEDAVDTGQRPKIDDFDHYIFGVFKMVYLNDAQEIKYEHLSIVLQENTVVVFQELEADVFDGVRNRLSQEESRIRARGADYLFFALLDAMVDHYFIAIELLSDKLDALENEVYVNPNQTQGLAIQKLKKEILKLRQHIYPTKDLVQRLLETKHSLISSETKVFLRDLLDHATEINESLQLYRELSMNLMELYMSTMSNKMNEVMKVLTIMASIFIPLTFIAGVYGMNFDSMPELHWEYGYTAVWSIMAICFIGMVLYFKRKNWL